MSKVSAGKRSGLQAGKFSIWTLQLWGHAVVIDGVWSLAPSSLNMQGLLWKRWHLDGWICPSKTCIYVIALMVTFQMCKLPVPEAVIHLHTIRDAVFHFSSAHFKWALAQRLWRLWINFTCGFFFALTCICGSVFTDKDFSIQYWNRFLWIGETLSLLDVFLKKKINIQSCY